MPIPLGVLAVAGAGAGPVVAGNAYEQLESVILTGTQANITFSNLNTNYGSTYQHLQLRGVLRTNRSGQTNDTVIYNLNSDAANNYSWHRLRGNGSSVTSAAAANQGRMEVSDAVSAGNTAANIFTPFILDILDPFETTKNKTTRQLVGQAATTYFGSGDISLWSNAWYNTAALTTITFDAIGDFIAGSRISLYGMRSS